MHRSRDLIAARSSEVITLADAAEEACLSPFHFHRLFVQTYGQTPHEFLTDQRLERARLLLARSNLSISEICLEAGYLSLGSFSTRFRQRVGCSPREYRQGSRRFWQSVGVPAHRFVPMCFLRNVGSQDRRSVAPKERDTLLTR